MKQYLIDTNIAIYYMKGKFNLEKKFDEVPDNCFISEITLAELKFGVENSEKPEKNFQALAKFLTGVKILPIFHSLDLYAKDRSPINALVNLYAGLCSYTFLDRLPSVFL